LFFFKTAFGQIKNFGLLSDKNIKKFEVDSDYFDFIETNSEVFGNYNKLYLQYEIPCLKKRFHYLMTPSFLTKISLYRLCL